MLEKVYLLKGSQTVEIGEYLNVKVLGFKREAPNLESQYISFEGSDGSDLVSSVYKTFILSMGMYIRSENDYDFELKLNNILTFFYDREPYYLVREKEPGKRYKVMPLPYDESKLNDNNGTIKIDFEVFEGHAESLATTLSGEGFNDNIFQFGQGLPMEDYEYQHKTNNFVIYNAGDFTVDPREHELKIIVKGVSEGGLNIFNKTTGERFIYNGSLYSTKGEVLTVEGVYPYKNGVNFGINTNGGLISLVPGVNEIEVTNITRVDVGFDFRFLYK